MKRKMQLTGAAGYVDLFLFFLPVLCSISSSFKVKINQEIKFSTFLPRCPRGIQNSKATEQFDCAANFNEFFSVGETVSIFKLQHLFLNFGKLNFIAKPITW